MPLKVFDDLDSVPEGLRDAAIETKDGKFAVSEDEDVTGLKVTLADQKEKARKAAQKARDLEAKVAELSAEQEAAKAGLSGDKLAEIRKQAEEKFKPVVDELEAKRQELRTLRLDSAVKGMLAKADAVDVEDAWKVLGSDFDLTDDGKPFLKADPSADIEKHIAGLRASKGHLFKGTQASGGGAGGSPGKGQPGQKSKPVSQWTPEEKQAYREQHGADAVQKLLDQQLRDSMQTTERVA